MYWAVTVYIICGLLATILLRYGTIWGRWFSHIWEFLFFLVIWWPCMLYLLLRRAWLLLGQGIRTLLASLNLEGLRTELARRADFVVFWLGRKFIERTDKGELWQGPAPLGVRARRLRVWDDTGTHWIRVPPQMESVKQALAWTFDVSESDYDPDHEA